MPKVKLTPTFLPHPADYNGEPFVSLIHFGGSKGRHFESKNIPVIICDLLNPYVKFLNLQTMVDNPHLYDNARFMALMGEWFLNHYETPPQVYLGINNFYYQGMLQDGFILKQAVVYGPVWTNPVESKSKKKSQAAINIKKTTPIDPIYRWDVNNNNYFEERWYEQR